MKALNLLKEDVAKFLEDNKNSLIYVSSSFKNISYYVSKLKELNQNVYFFRSNTRDLKEFANINVMLLEKLKEDKKNIIFIDFNLAMSIFFEKIDSFTLKKDKEYSLEKITEKLIEYGYEKKYIIENQGDFSKRADIIDIFSYNMEDPVRLDFFDIQLDKIKVFDIETQKSFDIKKEVVIYSNKLKESNYILTKLINKIAKNKFDLFVENEELLEYNLYTMQAVEEESKEKLKQRYDILIAQSKKIEVTLSKDRNYQSEIRLEKENKKKKGLKFKSVSEINKGDYVIHIQHGIGIYNGLELIDEKECISISYADYDKLYIPIENISRLEKYIGFNETLPTLYKLGTRGFKRKQKKYREDIEKVAKELIETQAKRENKKGISFSEDSIWQKEFEEKFEHMETKDQLLAINDVKRDMQSSKIMDRIVCGDVGYGKTEVAMRAAFKAVESGYQVMLLAPTTVLANQHYERFKKRFEGFPVIIDTYSRLSNSQKKIDDFLENKIDILIGTHKLLSDKIMYNNLGLLIIDEEQKFGVKAKESIKKRKADIDVLTLTATPIPRTLNLCLLGIRDISIISTPPLSKLPIKTEIFENISENDLRKIILNEISRDGQVFFVSNDVKNMPFKVKELEKILPDFVKIKYIHSKLPASVIKNTIKDFEDEKFHILVSSTIIENGIDILNANTIIIDDFYKLGLSQIYQLRGRVGRGQRQGYCYLLKKEYITKKGEQKQDTIVRLQDDISAGYNLSLEDMNIRGAGEILGEKQHGAIETFGYDFYLKLLNEEIRRQKGEIIREIRDVDVDISDKGYIPKEYIEDSERLKIYKRLSESRSFKEVNMIKEELIDRFGPLPNQAEKFIEYIKIKVYALKHNIEKIYTKNKKIYIKYLKKEKDVIKLIEGEFMKIVYEEEGYE